MGDNMSEQLYCRYCFNVMDHKIKFFSSYVLHFINDDATIPIFCSKECMLRWVAVRGGMSLGAVRSDFKVYADLDGR